MLTLQKLYNNFVATDFATPAISGGVAAAASILLSTKNSELIGKTHVTALAFIAGCTLALPALQAIGATLQGRKTGIATKQLTLDELVTAINLQGYKDGKEYLETVAKHIGKSAAYAGWMTIIAAIGLVFLHYQPKQNLSVITALAGGAFVGRFFAPCTSLVAGLVPGIPVSAET